ncbi:hypothetical protein EWI61_03565 [Methylolobus aquaticus]|nr:hypothetical protein EWI61_03565 [Methylolobus aquaticus]
MDAHAILATARSSGVVISLLPGGKLAAEPKAKITPALREAIREHKPAIVEALAEPVRWWRYLVHLPARTLEIDFASGATPDEARAHVSALWPDAGALVPLLRFPEPPLPGMMRVSLRMPGLSCDLDVRADRADAMGREARRRGLIRYQLRGDDGEALEGFSLECPKPGEDRAQCLERLRAEFGSRLILDDGEAEGP